MTGGRHDENHPRTRHTDHTWGRVAYLWRNLVPLFALIAAAVAITGQQSDIDRQKEGRRIAIDVLCGGSNGTVTAGRLILKDELPGTEKFQRHHSDREKAIADVYANAYAKVISLAVIGQAGASAKDVLRPDGTIDCDGLRDAASAVTTTSDHR